MTRFDQKKETDLCSWHRCSAKGKISVIDIDEPHGEKLLLCMEHYDQYTDDLRDEMEQLNSRLPPE